MSTSIPLLHVWDNQKIAPRTGLFPIGDGVEIPKTWELPPGEYDARALPTPFARAEATRLVIGRVDEAAEHPLLLQFQWLLLGIASGVLTVEPQDLTSPAFDNFGRALLNVGEDVRYLGRIVWLERELAFGATYPSCLVWSHARRTQSEWDALAQAVQPHQTHALAVLADWRELIRQAGRWNRERVAWQRGVDYVLGETGPSAGLETFHRNSSSVGPVHLDLPTNEAESATQRETVYLPTYSPGFADAFVKLCNFQPSSAPGAVEFRDGQGKAIGRIRLPAVGADADPIALGMGTLEMLDRVSPRVPLAEQKLWVQAKGGLVEHLKPLALALSQRGHPLVAAAVNGAPFVYPDPIRVLFQRGYWPDASPGARRDRLTGRAELLLASKGLPLPSGEEAEANGGGFALLGTGDATLRAAFLDQFNGVEVLDLRAIGLILFRVFIRDANIGAEAGGNIEDAESLAPLLIHSAEHPLEPHADVYKTVSAGPAPTLAKQLATLQRLVAAYSGPVSASGVGRVLDRAARSFASWAHGSAVVPLGRRPSKPTDFVQFRLPTGLELRLARDPIHNPLASQ
jgi:hypothetical protein